MTRSWALVLLVLPLACTCYERPVVRDLNAIGSPSPTVTATDPRTLHREGPTHVVAHGEPTLQERGNEFIGDRDTPPLTRSMRGTLQKSAAGRVVIEPVGAPDMELRIDRKTSILMDGRVIGPELLSEGAEVRASWHETAAGKRAARIEVLPSRL